MPDKPAGEIATDKSGPIEERQAMKNRGEVRRENYPDKASGKDTIGGSGE